MQFKKLIVALCLSTSLTSVSYAKDFMAYCSSIQVYGSKPTTTIKSNHGLSIVNNTKVAQTFHITFDNLIQYPKREMPLDYSDAPFTPNAHFQFDVTVQPGKRYDYGQVIIGQDAYFAHVGHYKTMASTIIKVNNTVLDACTHYNYAHITE